MFITDEMALWTRVVLGAGYPSWLIVDYLMREFGVGYEEGRAVAMAAHWAANPAPLIE